jgi:phosphoribosyl-AMP cyclohydrolase
MKVAEPPGKVNLWKHPKDAFGVSIFWGYGRIDGRVLAWLSFCLAHERFESSPGASPPPSSRPHAAPVDLYVAFRWKTYSSARWRSKPSGFFVFIGSVFGRKHVEIAFEKSGGLVPAIIQDGRSGQVLMLGFMNAEALAETQRTGEAVFFSRSRKRLWKKGETSGHVLRVLEMRIDCDADALLLRVEPVGPGVCHQGYCSCFFRRVEDGGVRTVEERTFDPATVYTSGTE